MFKPTFQKFIFSLIIVCLGLSLAAGAGAQADTAPAPTGDLYNDIIKTKQLDELKKIGLPGETANPYEPIITIIRLTLGMVAFIFLVLILYAGFRWMTSGGASEAIDSAKKIIKASLIGLLIIFLSYSFTLLVFNVLLKPRP